MSNRLWRNRGRFITLVRSATFLLPLVMASLFARGRKASSFPLVGGHQQRNNPALIARGRNANASSLPLKTTSIFASQRPSSTGQEESRLILPGHPDIPIKSIGAPMVGMSDYPFRALCRRHGVDLSYSQMLLSKTFVRDPKFRKCHLDFWETGRVYDKLLKSQKYLLGDLEAPSGHPEDGRRSPIVVQVAGNDVDLILLQAEKLMHHTGGRLSGIDLNLGCPQSIARKGNYGAFLMESNPEKAIEILTALRNFLPSEVAVSAKIRLPLDDKTLRERILRLLSTGINFLTIHGRTLYENKTKVAECHVDRLRLAVETAHKVDPTFPIVANGGIEHYEDVDELLKKTGAVAAMSSESLLETPNVFKQSSRHLSPRELFHQQLSFALGYLALCSQAPPLPGVLGEKTNGSVAVLRSHIFRFLHRYLMEEPDLIERLASGNSVQTIGQAISLLDELESRYDKLSDGEWNERESSRPESSWYRRHRKPNRRVKQKEVKINSSLAPVQSQTEEMSVEKRKVEIRARLARMKETKKTRKTFI